MKENMTGIGAANESDLPNITCPKLTSWPPNVRVPPYMDSSRVWVCVTFSDTMCGNTSFINVVIVCDGSYFLLRDVGCKNLGLSARGDNNFSSEFGLGLEYVWSSLISGSLYSACSSSESWGKVESGVHPCLGHGELAYNFIKVTTYETYTFWNITTYFTYMLNMKKYTKQLNNCTWLNDVMKKNHC